MRTRKISKRELLRASRDVLKGVGSKTSQKLTLETKAAIRLYAQHLYLDGCERGIDLAQRCT
jgi:hypothetical protein